MSASNPSDPDVLQAPSPSLRGFLVAWGVFWVLQATVSVQDYQRSGHAGFWPPLLWEGSSCMVASVIAWMQWSQLYRQDRLLGNAWRWFGTSLVWLPPVAVSFVAVVYALRHAAYALAGTSYRHEPWGQVFAYEAIKFSLFYLLFMAVLFGMRSNAVMVAERLRVERLRTLTQQAQVLQLTQQLEPHFLFNALNTIASAIHTDPGLADTLVLRLATLLRAATDLARQPQVTLERELELLRAYADIMLQRFAGRVTLHWDVADACLPCSVPALVLQPLLENAFRHGVEQLAGPCVLMVSCRCNADVLRLVVENDAGALGAVPTMGTGLTNLRQRLQLLYGERAALTLTPRDGGGVRAAIELPCVS